jgi:hypothetical protein
MTKFGNGPSGTAGIEVTVRRMPLSLLYLLLFALLFAATGVSGVKAVTRRDAAANGQLQRSGNWGARTSTGRTLLGTWTAVPDTTNGTVTGTWTLVDAQDRTVASGAWSAAKSPTQWTGAWRAVIAGSAGEYSGTWTAGVDLKVDASFPDLFELAADTLVSGTWRAGSQSEAWSIRALKREGGR